MATTRTVQRAAAFLAGGECRDEDAGKLVLVHMNIFAYALCFWVQQPVLPFLSEELGASAVGFGKLESAMSLMALLGGATMGRVTDLYGAKATLITSHAGSLVMYSLMGIATSYWLLFASRIPAYVQHAMLCSQAALSDLVPLEQRSVAMGRLSLSYAVGMVLGSPLGGKLAELVGYRGAALAAASVTLLVIVVDVLLLPAFHKESKTKEGEKTEGKPGVMAQVRAFVGVLCTPSVSALLAFILPISVGIGAFRSMFSLAGTKEFGLESSGLGMYISFAAFVGLLTNVFIIQWAQRSLGSYRTVLAAAAVQAVCYAATSYATTLEQLLAITVPSTVASTLLYTLSSSLMSLAVDAGNTGTAISISHGSRSLVGILSPVVGGMVYDSLGFYGIGWFASACCLASMAVALTVAGPTLVQLAAAGKAASSAESAKKGD